VGLVQTTYLASIGVKSVLYDTLESILSLRLDRKAVDTIMLFFTFAIFWFMLYITLIWLTEHWKTLREVDVMDTSMIPEEVKP
jgi:hypothetical protein